MLDRGYSTRSSRPVVVSLQGLVFLDFLWSLFLAMEIANFNPALGTMIFDIIQTFPSMLCLVLVANKCFRFGNSFILRKSWLFCFQRFGMQQ